MAARIEYGTHTHRVGEVRLAISRRPNLAENGSRLSITERWDLQGTLIRTAGGASLISQIQAIETAYSRDGQDLEITLDGVQAHRLRSSSAIGGVRIVSPISFPEGGGVELATRRTYSVSLEATYPVDGSGLLLVSFSETLEFTGGGPLYGHIETLEGPPIKFRARQMTVSRATQSGDAVGYRTWPLVPPPIWPAAQVEAVRTRAGSPKKVGRGSDADYTEFPISWTYRFESAMNLTGRPTRWSRNS